MKQSRYTEERIAYTCVRLCWVLPLRTISDTVRYTN